MAQVQPIDIVAPGALGLNTEQENTLLTPQWATRALNCVVNRSGRIAARRGWVSQTSTGISGSHNIDVLHEYLQEDGTSTIISTANNKIYKNLSDFTDAANDITSATAPTADNWQFINFNGFVLGFQTGHNPIQWNGSGDFADQSLTTTGQAGTFDAGNAALAAFGRVWIADEDLQTIRYSSLLDHTDYSTASGGGVIDMTSVWTGGMDRIVAIAAIGGNLVVFGRNHIILWADGSGSEIGIDPEQIEVVDTIEGTGCIARDSVTATGEGDLLYLSRTGVQSLRRVIETKSNPMTTLTKYVRARIIEAIAQQQGGDAQLTQVKAVHSPEEGLYIINFPTANKMFVLDTQHPFRDNQEEMVFPVTEWQVGGDIRGLLTTTSGSLYFGGEGVVGLYSGNDDNGAAYDWEFLTGWLDFDQLNHRLKFLKEIIAQVAIGGASSLTWVWEFDFSGDTLTRTVSYTGATQAEFGTAEFNVDEFSGGVVLQRKSLPAYGEGQFIRLGVTASINGFDAVLQQISISPKIGRMIS